MRERLITTLSVLTLFPVTASAASFDCKKSHSPVEIAICRDQTLSDLDTEMADAFKNALAVSGELREKLTNNQKEWLKNRCNSSDCLETSYRKRISLLKIYSSDQTAFSQDIAPCTALTKSFNKGTLRKLPLGDSITTVPGFVEAGEEKEMSGHQIAILLADNKIEDVTLRENANYPISGECEQNQCTVYNIHLTSHDLLDIAIEHTGGTDVCRWYDIFTVNSSGGYGEGAFFGDMCESLGEEQEFVKFNGKSYMAFIQHGKENMSFEFISFTNNGDHHVACSVKLPMITN